MSHKAGLDVPRSILFHLEKEAAHVTQELKNLADKLPPEFRKQVQGLSQETNHMHDDISHIKGLHWSGMRREDFED